MRIAFRVAGFCTVAAAALTYALNLSAAVTLPNNVFVYSENFDGTKLGATTLTGAASPFSPNIGTQVPIPGTSGWDATKFAGTGTTNMPYTVEAGAGASGGIYSYGAASTTERALGALASGTNIPTFGVEIVNNTGSIIDSVNLQYVAEWWHGSSSTAETGLSFRYLVSSSGSTNYLTSSSLTAFSGLDLPPPPVDAAHPNGALDGNAAANQPAAPIAGLLSGLNWTPGTSLYISWRDADNAGSDAGMGIDNFQLTANALTGVKPYWDPNGAAAGLGGAGTWNTTSSNWNDNSGTGTPGTFTSSAVAIFSGTGGTVTIDPAGVTIGNGMQVESDGYTITGGPLTVGSTAPITVLNPAHTLTIASKISGSNGLTKGGAGTLALTSNANDFVGPVTIGAGTLLISNDANLGDPSNGIVLSGGTLKLATPGNLSISANRSLTGSGGTVDIGAGNTLTLQGSVNMAGTLGLAAQGNITFSQSAPTVGGLALPGAGTVQVGDGSPANTLTINNAGGNTITANNTTGTLAVNGSLSLGGSGTGTRFINVPNAGATFQVTGNLSAIARVGYSGPGTFDLKGDNSGVIAGLQIGSSGTAGPVVKIYNSNSLGTISFGIVSNFLNSGTFDAQGTSPIAFTNNGELLSIGSVAAAPFTFSGAAMDFQAPVNIFRPSGTAAVRINVNNSTTFSRGWNVANTTGTPGDTGTLTNTTGGLIVGGTGTLTLTGGSFANLVVPVTADGATVIFDGINPNNSGVVNFGGVTGQTSNLQIGATNNGRFNLTTAKAFAGTGDTPAPGKVVLSAGGRLGTGGVAQTFGTLSVTNNTSIDVGNSGANSAPVLFADSSSVTWAAGSLLSINNWNGTVGTGGGLEQVVFGNSAAALTATQVGLIHFAGYNGAQILSTGEVVPTAVSTKVLGDFNNDGQVTTADIRPMLIALTDLTAFRTANSLTTTDDFLNVADVDLSGKVDNLDIQALLNKFSGAGSIAAVPEPAGVVLCLIGLPAMAFALRRRKK